MKSWMTAVVLGVLALSAVPSALCAGSSPKKAEPKTTERKSDLTPEQKSKLEAAFAEERAASTVLRDEYRLNFAKLQWQVDSKADAKDLAETLGQLDKLHRQMMDEHMKLEQKIAETLTPAQRARQMLSMRGGFMGFGGPRAGGGPDLRGEAAGRGGPWPRGERVERGDERAGDMRGGDMRGGDMRGGDMRGADNDRGDGPRADRAGGPSDNGPMSDDDDDGGDGR